MNGKYYFNGKDITMNVCIQIRDVIDIIKEKSQLTFQEAAGAFYHSQTYKTLQKTRFGQKMQAISQTVIMKNKIKKRWRMQKRKKEHFLFRKDYVL